MDKVSYVNCPECKGEFYVERAEYAGNPDAPVIALFAPASLRPEKVIRVRHSGLSSKPCTTGVSPRYGVYRPCWKS